MYIEHTYLYEGNIISKKLNVIEQALKLLAKEKGVVDSVIYLYHMGVGY